MTIPSSVLSQTLQSITTTKVAELKKQYATSKNKVDDCLAKADAGANDPQTRILHLVQGVKALEPNAAKDHGLRNIERWVEQSYYDPMVSDSLLSDFDQQLRKRLEVQMRKLDHACLYSNLLTEWLSKPTTIEEEFLGDDGGSIDSFEVLERDRLKDLREKFEEVVFNPQQTDEVEIDLYLSDLFSGENGEAALQRLRKDLKALLPNMEHPNAFDSDQLTWCIKSLLYEELLNDQKKQILRDFLHDEVALREIVDVLNMRWKDIANWTWDAGDSGIPVEPRRQLNGKWRVMMDEDILQAIFVEHIGIKFSIAFKRAFRNILEMNLWRSGPSMSAEEADRRRFYLGENEQTYSRNSVEGARHTEFEEAFFLCQLPSRVQDMIGSYDDDEKDKQSNEALRSWSTIRQQLLRKLTTEIMFHKYLKGNVAVLQSDMQWYAAGLPHSTIFALLRFCGISGDWIAFFKKFLEAPLNMEPVSDQTHPQVKIRKRGVPLSHAIAKALGELVLVFMDIAVNKETGMLLYRLHDDLWLCGEAADCAMAWQTMKDYAKIMGLEFNQSKTGSLHLGIPRGDDREPLVTRLPNGPVTFGFLKLDPSDAKWTVDQDAVNAHIRQLKKQLSGCTSVLAWIQTWNSCIGRFFGHTLGEPAYCLGREHVDSIVRVHSAMQRELFQKSAKPDHSVTRHLKEMIATRFDAQEIPDGFLLLPQDLGGLGVKNPFISLFLISETLSVEPPKAMIGRFLKDEEKEYNDFKEKFEKIGPQRRRQRFNSIYTQTAEHRESHESFPDVDKFMGKEEFTRWRESLNSGLTIIYNKLQKVPAERAINLSGRVSNEFRGKRRTAEDEWLVQLFSEELYKDFGGIDVVDQTLLPLGLMEMIRNSKVKWQMVL